MVTPQQPYQPQSGYPGAQGYPSAAPYPPPYPGPARRAASALDWVTAGLLVLSALLTAIWRFTSDYFKFIDNIAFLMTAVLVVVTAIVLVTGAGARNPAFRALAAAAAGTLFAPSLDQVVAMVRFHEVVEVKDFALNLPAFVFALGAVVTAISATAQSRGPRTLAAPTPPPWQPQPPATQFQRPEYPPQSQWPPH
ncbi:hypothetical protein [Nocardia sp. NPDC052112]|uniref:hypothetical protein n=1 Tax=Nocardia sp. NPDC052112 TaxID=3155646 RepID=UPI0034287EA6